MVVASERTSPIAIISTGLRIIESFTSPAPTSAPIPSGGWDVFLKPQSLYPSEKRVVFFMPYWLSAPSSPITGMTVGFTFGSHALSGRAAGQKNALRLLPIKLIKRGCHTYEPLAVQKQLGYW